MRWGWGSARTRSTRDELAFVYEKNLKVLPTFAVMLGYAAYWLRLPEIGVTWDKVVHGEQGLTLHAPVAPQGTVIGAHAHLRRGRQRRGQRRAGLFAARDHRQGERRACSPP